MRQGAPELHAIKNWLKEAIMKNTKTLDVDRIRGASVIKLILLGSTTSWILVTSVCGVAALFGAEVIQWNGQYVTGMKGLIASPFIGAFVGILFGLFSAAFTYLGLRFYSLFRGISVEYVPANSKTET
jgi:hypothetical protein